MNKTNRREFVQTAIKATLITSIGTPFLACATKATTETEDANNPSLLFSQIKLPYTNDALEPSIDTVTMDIHYNKHHAAYVKNVNDAIEAENIIAANEQDFFSNISKLSAKARNNGGGTWNHNFFWQVMKPNGGGVPSGKIGDAITGAFGSFDAFKEKFTAATMTRFGSGWAWLVNSNGKLTIGSTPNQDNPIMDAAELRGTPLLALDVWEHAYYLKYQNKRNEYVANWWNVINWDEVAKRLS